MRKYEVNDTRMMTPDEVKAMAEVTVDNPTITQMIFVETAPVADGPKIGLFPCYPTYWDEEKKILAFYALQCSGGRYFTAEVHIKEEDIGKRIWFWTMPPADNLAQAVVLAAKITMDTEKEEQVNGPALHDGES